MYEYSRLAGSALILGLAATPTSLAQQWAPGYGYAAEDSRVQKLENRVNQLERMNLELLSALEHYGALQQAPPAHAPPPQPADAVERVEASNAPSAKPALRGRMSVDDAGVVGVSSETSFKILDHAEHTNTKPLKQLQARAKGKTPNKVTLGGGITALATYQRSNRDSKFGYLMRNPTSANQIGQDVSEAVVHSAQLSATANLTDTLTAYIEMLYNPEQSFGSGTITDLNRNQVQVRRAYLMYGDLSRYPVYAAIGKMDVPFGMNDTVSPFTNSTNWHSFAALAYGAQAGYYNHGLHARIMAIQGGAQFRAANSPVEDTSVPSRINNFAVDVNYTADLTDSVRLMGGASYIHGSAYCQDYPIFHFDPCTDNNPAYSVYSRMNLGNLELIGEFAETTDIWPGTAVPDQTNPLSVFDAVKSQAWTVGGRYAFNTPWAPADDDLLISLEASQFRAGDDGAPWERQNQFVAGVSQYLTPSVNLFGEYVHVDGFAPLNFLSGGNFPDGSTWSDADATTDAIVLGLQAAF